MPTAPFQTWEPSTGKLDPLYSAEKAIVINGRLAAGTYVKGTVLGEVSATPGIYKPYAAGNSDGSQVAKTILQYACVADSSGNLTLAGEFGQTQLGAPMYAGGGAVFNTAELTGLDAAAVTALGASLIEGTLAAGQLRF